MIPLPFPLIVHFWFIGTSDIRGTAVGLLNYYVGVLDLVVVAMQMAALLWARSSIVGDQVNSSGMAWARRVLTLFSALILVAALTLAVVESFSGFGIGVFGIVPMLFIAAFGSIARYRLRKIEKFVAWRDPGTRRPPLGARPPRLPPYTPR